MFKKPWNVVNSIPIDFENPPDYNPDEFSYWWNVWLSHLVLLVKLVLKNKMYNVINWKRKTKEFINPPKCSCSTISVHNTVDGRHTNFLCMFKLGVCVYWARRVLFLNGCREGCKLQSLIKTTSSGQIESDENGTIGLVLIIFSEI